ncbi:helix-turn-helix domain-containing protein [Desulfoluna spongiiphila]|uniref:Helix-turn-helix domain-containing protein n=1 Tax=Desulfoluna spongiiphila TaxID=419481 RepID=A0A1G5IFE9_9BACT|nr:helix-turn-helix domain-containing protein [Desulfoluna spongiiphila]SCY74677.1 Helix-turn-helix domain-containing protein [Desulfoluna spongiiphila]VVS95447.1 helix-turn-helix domain [Desulfoluna spongiiphila]
MAENNDEVRERPQFNEYLRETRLQHGITVEAVCRETKLSRHVVESIEAGNRSVLPEDVLLKSFLRSMAEACGADGDTAVSLYLEAHPPSREGASFCSPGNRKRNLGLVFILICLVSLVVGGVSFFFDAP